MDEQTIKIDLESCRNDIDALKRILEKYSLVENVHMGELMGNIHYRMGEIKSNIDDTYKGDTIELFRKINDMLNDIIDGFDLLVNSTITVLSEKTENYENTDKALSTRW